MRSSVSVFTFSPLLILAMEADDIPASSAYKQNTIQQLAMLKNNVLLHYSDLHTAFLVRCAS